jgi:hypothetical protein
MDTFLERPSDCISTFLKEGKNVVDGIASAMKLIEADANLLKVIMRIKLKLNCFKSIPLWKSLENGKQTDSRLLRWVGMVQDNGYDTELYVATCTEGNLSPFYHTKEFQGKDFSADYNAGHLEVSSVFAVSVPGQSAWVSAAGDGVQDLAGILQNVSINEQSKEDNNKTLPHSNKVSLPWEHGQSEGVLLQFTSGTDLLLGQVIEVYGYVREYRGDVPVFCVLSHKVLAGGQQKEMFNANAVSAVFESNMTNWVQVRQSLVNWLAETVLYGDHLAAEYMLVWMVSHVYKKLSDVALGGLNMMLIRCPPVSADGVSFGSELHKALSSVLPQVVNFPLTIEFLNKSTFIPKFHAGMGSDHLDPLPGQLTAGLLQLAHDTHVIVDQTTMSEGNLDNRGVLNLQQLHQTMMNSSLNCNSDFGDSHFSFPVSLSWLVLSDCDSVVGEGGQTKSLLPSDMVLPLEKRKENSVMALNEGLMQLFRFYLMSLRNSCHDNWDISEEVAASIQKDFVEDRKKVQDKKNLGAMKSQSDLMLRMTLARWLSISRGESSLSPETWEHVKQMESARSARYYSDAPGI